MNLIPDGWFENDGCTFWFDSWFGIDTAKCCSVHDEAFSHGHKVIEFLQANWDLMTCGIHMGAPVWGFLAGIGVTVLGVVPFFYGNKKPGLEEVTVIDPTQRHNSVRDGVGQGETGSAGETVEQERK